jgi:hypothetical protein
MARVETKLDLVLERHKRFSYFRRVAEDIIDRFMSALRQCAADTGSTELIAAIDERQATTTPRRLFAVADGRARTGG